MKREPSTPQNYPEDNVEVDFPYVFCLRILDSSLASRLANSSRNFCDVSRGNSMRLGTISYSDVISFHILMAEWQLRTDAYRREVF